MRPLPQDYFLLADLQLLYNYIALQMPIIALLGMCLITTNDTASLLHSELSWGSLMDTDWNGVRLPIEMTSVS